MSLKLKKKRNLHPEGLRRIEVRPRFPGFSVRDDLLQGSYDFMRELMRGDDGVIRRMVEFDGLTLEIPLHGDTWESRLEELVMVSKGMSESSGHSEAEVLALLLKGDGWVMGDNVSPPLWLDGGTVMMEKFLEVADGLGARLDEISKET